MSVAKPRGIGEKYIEFVIDEGVVTVHPHGFTDGSCHAATAQYEQALGKVTSRKITGPDCQQTVKTRVK